MSENVLLAFTLTVLAGLCTGIGSALAFFTKRSNKAFLSVALGFSAGVSEPVGAIIGYTILKPFFSQTVFGLLFAAVAGIMVFISLDELLPTAKEYEKGHMAIYGLIGGMAVMALSLLLFM